MNKKVEYGWVRQRGYMFETGDSDWDGKYYTPDINRAHLYESGTFEVRRVTITTKREFHDIVVKSYKDKWVGKCVYCGRHQNGKPKALKETVLESIEKHPCICVTVNTTKL